MKKYLKNINKDGIIEIIKYCIFGVITSLFNLLIYIILIKININYLIATVISYFIAVLISYYFNVKYVFNEKFISIKNIITTLSKFLSVRLGAILVELILMYIIVDILVVDEILAKLICSFITITGTYFFNKAIIKKRKEDDGIVSKIKSPT